MKNPGKTAKLISLADLVFAGNQYLADYAHHHNENILIVPTTIDTDEYKQTPFRDAEQLCIGWSGSITTIRHFEVVIPVLHRLKNKYGNKLVFKVIGDANFSVQELGIQGIRWSKQDELDELSKIDIGIMPLPDDEWSKGKCGLKGLQYMALGIATVMSPVGVNTEIIQNGTNGFLATTDDEWFGVLCQLIDDADLRKRMGEAARKTVVEKYSVESQKKVYYNAMMGLMTKKLS
jgi:glycosyltransferase involved in cell wall biosynthesis